MGQYPQFGQMPVQQWQQPQPQQPAQNPYPQGQGPNPYGQYGQPYTQGSGQYPGQGGGMPGGPSAAAQGRMAGSAPIAANPGAGSQRQGSKSFQQTVTPLVSAVNKAIGADEASNGPSSTDGGTNMKSIIGFVSSMTSLSFCLSMLRIAAMVAMLAWGFSLSAAIAGVTFGLIGMKECARTKSGGQKLAFAAVVIGFLCLAAAVVFLIGFGSTDYAKL